MFLIVSCEDDLVPKESENASFNPGLDYRRGDLKSVDFRISYDVQTERIVNFDYDIDERSPAWKRLQSIPEAESSSLKAQYVAGNLSMTQDFITSRSALSEMKNGYPKINKLSYSNGLITADYVNGEKRVIKQELSLGDVSGLVLLPSGSGDLDTSRLIAEATRHKVSNNKLHLIYLREAGADGNFSATIDLRNGRPITAMFYDDRDPQLLVATVHYQFDRGGQPTRVIHKLIDYLDDGDIRRETVIQNLSNYSFSQL